MNRHFRVLVVDDSKEARELYRYMLERLGYEALLAADGGEAVEAVRGELADLVLMDCQMPVMDGYAATGRIRCFEKKRIPIVGIPINMSPEEYRRCIDAGMDDCVGKPNSINEVAKLVGKWDVPINLSVLRGLMTAASEKEAERLKKVLTIFLKEVPVRIHVMKKAFFDEEYDTMALTAHTLKGSSGCFGAFGLQTLCSKVEDSIRHRDHEDIKELLLSIEEEFSRVRKVLEQDPETLMKMLALSAEDGAVKKAA